MHSFTSEPKTLCELPQTGAKYAWTAYVNRYPSSRRYGMPSAEGVCVR